jgi:hypothetical protein
MTAEKDHAPGASEEAKARFREALERKKQASHRSAEGRSADGGVHGPEVTGGKRTFRRKTGCAARGPGRPRRGTRARVRATSTLARRDWCARQDSVRNRMVCDIARSASYTSGATSEAMSVTT